MDLHNHYLHFSTANISLLQTISDFKSNLHYLIQSYNREMVKEELDLGKLEFYRSLLCQEYQFVFPNIERGNRKYVIITDVEKLCLPNINMIFPSNYLRSTLEISLLCDIINLQMILYCDTSSMKRYLKDIFRLSDSYFAASNSRIMYMKILEYFLEFLHLYKLHTTSEENEELEDFSHMYLEIVKLWLKLKEDCEWKLFASMFPKLIQVFTPECIAFPLWDHLLREIIDLKEFLTDLSIMADICFTSSDSMYHIHRDIYCSKTFWLFILKGLRSPLQQYRKQALYIMKKAIDSISENVSSFTQANLTKAEVTPFICNRFDMSSSIERIKERFFLLYEALEEKQEHLITPVLFHVATLAKINKDHRTCDCFNIIWLRCIFEKILLHENNFIAKWGVTHVCKLDDDTIFDDQFLELFIGILNNNFLYECHSNEECPGIVEELSQFLRYAKKSDLLNRFLKKINCVAWGPVAIFYVIHVLQTVSHEGPQYSEWQASELNAIKVLVEINLSAHSHILRTASQIELLRAIPNCAQRINDLPLLANVLATFPSGEGLVRGTAPWNVIKTWLQTVLKEGDVVTFMEKTCASYKQGNVNLEMNPRTFAIMVYLMYDASLLSFFGKPTPAMEALNNLLYILNDISVRPYADIISSMNVVEFISHLLHLSVKGPRDKMTNFISSHMHTTFNFLIKNTRRISVQLTYEDYTRYVRIVSSHVANAPFFMSEKDIRSYGEKLENESLNLIRNLQTVNMQYLYGLHVLHLSQNILVLPTLCKKHLLGITSDINMVNLKGKIASEYYLLLLKLMHRYLVNSPVASWISVAAMLTNLLKFLDVGLPENVSEIAKILTVMIDNKVVRETSDRETLEYTLNLSFTCIDNGKKNNNVFWMAIQNLMGVIINNNFLLLPNAVQFTEGYIVKLLNEGEITAKFKRILLSKLKNLDVQNLMRLKSPLTHCLFHSPIYRRDKKIENHAHLFIDKYLGHYYPKHVFILDSNNDTAIRAEAIVLLHRIISYSESDCIAYVNNHAQTLLDTLKTNKTKRYFNDSPLHKFKHRIMQILLILEPALSEDYVCLLQEELCDLIFSESNQSSVKIMQEWLLVRIFTKNIHLRDKLWSLFEKSIKQRPTCTISMASIVYHIAKLLSRDEQKIFIRTALPYIVQCCLGQQFSARIYNQFILTRLYDLMEKTFGDNSILEYKAVYQAAVIGLLQECSTKNSFKIQDDFYFSNFHPFEDYSLETIYYELPRLTNVSRDEWISPTVFKDLMFKENDNHSLRHYNVNSFPTNIESSVYLTKFFTGDMHTKLLENNVESCMEGVYDIQKKINPSKPINLCNDICEMMNEFIFLQDTQSHEGLIVVASFVERSPNLGGIARTCEILGVRALVVANANCVKDKEFQYLSVSADKWLNILQVKPHELQKFLLDKKNAGWSLIGVEQTVNSVNLTTMTFEKRTILVLGVLLIYSILRKAEMWPRIEWRLA
ncbi:uncharacterized protein LOC105193761 isoform X2 [Solenopsis invicta]|uniref:uncharacterized protein LOC105193761 isoform X2 n=1 Tax=Solenopsis invicta TaxID=13686 RepID=UPI00193E8E21|nr:uncharacterized protein LOC105193761 isoform X2 [Solenopsis invicta]